MENLFFIQLSWVTNEKIFRNFSHFRLLPRPPLRDATTDKRIEKKNVTIRNLEIRHSISHRTITGTKRIVRTTRTRTLYIYTIYFNDSNNRTKKKIFNALLIIYQSCTPPPTPTPEKKKIKSVHIHHDFKRKSAVNILKISIFNLQISLNEYQGTN